MRHIKSNVRSSITVASTFLFVAFVAMNFSLHFTSLQFGNCEVGSQSEVAFVCVNVTSKAHAQYMYPTGNEAPSSVNNNYPYGAANNLPNPVANNQGSGDTDGLKNPLGPGNDSLEAFLRNVIAILRIFAVPIIIFMIIYAGFLYVLARGNEEQVTKATRALTYAIIGGLLIIGAELILSVIQGTVSQLAP